MFRLAALAGLLAAPALAQPPPPAGDDDATVCGTDGASQTVAITEASGTRTITSNGCPGYDWTDQTTPNDAVESENEYALPIDIQFCETPSTVGLASPVMGTIGVSLSGVSIFGPADADGDDAYIEESETFNECMGHPNEFGEYHYHANHPCVLEELDDDEDAHSPIIGFMVDGIPIYGLRGANGSTPTDLDTCGGHVGSADNGESELPFYHYHVQTSYPYTVDCLVGRVDEALEAQNGELSAISECTVDDSVSYDYSSLEGIAPVDFDGTMSGAAQLSAPSVALLAGVVAAAAAFL